MKSVKTFFCFAVLITALIFAGCAGSPAARTASFSGPLFMDADNLVSMGQPNHGFYGFSPPAWEMELPFNDIDMFENARYMVIASVGGGTSGGFGGLKFALQGDAPNNFRPILIGLNAVEFHHSPEDIVYFAIDIKKFELEYSNQLQFFVDAGLDSLGTIYVYMTHVNLEANKPDDAVDLTVQSIEHVSGTTREELEVPEGMTLGFVTRNIPLTPRN